MRWTRVSGRVARFFDDVVILASRSLPKRFTDALQPWGLEALTEYRPDYLSGFRAEGYTVDLDEGMEEARGIMDARIRHDIARDIGGDAQRIGVVETRLSDVTFKHILLPVWVAAYRYAASPTASWSTARPARCRANAPIRPIKIAIAVILAILIGAAVLYGLQLADQGGMEFGMAPGPWFLPDQVTCGSARCRSSPCARLPALLFGLLGHADRQDTVLQPRRHRLGIGVRRQAEGPRERPVGPFGEEIGLALLLPFRHLLARDAHHPVMHRDLDIGLRHARQLQRDAVFRFVHRRLRGRREPVGDPRGHGPERVHQGRKETGFVRRFDHGDLLCLTQQLTRAIFAMKRRIASLTCVNWLANAPRR
jgi:hypothetical protein